MREVNIMTRLLNEILKGVENYNKRMLSNEQYDTPKGNGSKAYVNKRIDLLREYLGESRL